MLSILKKLTILIVFLLIMGAFLSPKFFPNEDISKASRVAAWGHSISMSIDAYYRELNEFPQGTSKEICEALTGKNPKQEVFISRKCKSLLDPWGMPYDIHVSPNGEIEIISAGENQIFGDKDDYVFKDKIEVTTSTKEETILTDRQYVEALLVHLKLGFLDIHYQIDLGSELSRPQNMRTRYKIIN